MRIFISHISEEALEATALKKGIKSALPDIEVFVSSVDIELGDPWLTKILKELEEVKVILALCSPASVRNPWINFEIGSAYAKGARVVPVCYKGLNTDQLPDPLAIFQTFELKKATSFRNMVDWLSTYVGVKVAENFNPLDVMNALNKASQKETASNTTEVGIVLTHRQDQWEKNRKSVFTLPDSLPETHKDKWSFRLLEDERTFLSKDLNELSGIILAIPWHSKMSPETIHTLVEWVRSGGRMLLLGFELGDRHHNSNLSELSHHFGIDPTSGDIVGPRGNTNNEDAGFGIPKPYGEPVFFDIISNLYSLTNGLANICLRNSQTVRVDPGGKEWLYVGQNYVCTPRADSVQYNDGIMATPGINYFVTNKSAGWLPVAVEAPKGLCEKGGVIMIGTWDLLDLTQEFAGDNLILLEGILNWLSHKD